MRNAIFCDCDVSGEPGALVFRNEQQPNICWLLTCHYAQPHYFILIERLLDILFIREKVGINFLRNEDKVLPNINESHPRGECSLRYYFTMLAEYFLNLYSSVVHPFLFADSQM
jgi:hypothetical protein